MNHIWCSNNCLCQKCKSYWECEPCCGDWDYEHTCPGKCNNFEPQENEEQTDD